MALPPNKKQQQFFGPSLVGACLAVIASVPVTAYLASLFGSTYNLRAGIYCGMLLWIVVGAVSVFLLTQKSETQTLSPRFILLWFLSTWLWPIPVLMGMLRKSK